jgi:hypothetical protein
MHALLTEWYALCERLLGECVTASAFHLDVVADEMFCVVFRPGEEGRVLPMHEALSFAKRLLVERATLTTRQWELCSVDIGIAHGPVLIGMMGPEGHRKTTGLGEIPGRASRLRAAGTLLRRELGDQDRIILDDGGFRIVADQEGFRSFVLAAGRGRDLEGGVLHYWEDTYAEPRREGAA